MDGTDRLLTIVSYVTALAVAVAAGLVQGASPRELGTLEVAAAISLGVPALCLSIFSLFGLISYFAFIPSIKNDAHIFSRAHATHLLHPLTTSLVLGLAAVCLLTGNPAVWGLWGLLLLTYLVQTALFVQRIRRQRDEEAPAGTDASLLSLVLNLVVGGELATLVGGARPLPPWRLRSLPEDTWIVDVRTKPEFYWNRLQGAESFPWGLGIAEASRDKPKDRPVLVACLSGHRSPAVAGMMRKLGFKTVYNLNWGILYLILIERGRKSEGPFALTRPHRDPDRRGQDHRLIAQAYVALLLLTLVGAPLEKLLVGHTLPLVQTLAGASLTLAGLTLAILSFRALGRNFRIYAAPRRSGTLVTTGIYSQIRHPMYTGVIVALGGYVLLLGSRFFVPVWFAVTLLYLIKAVKEERILAEKFPQYESYRRRTWRFLPYVH